MSRQLDPSQPYLSYYDSRLTKEDVNVTKNDWLTDNVISFWEEYLEREYLIEFKNSKIVLLRPTITQIVKEEDQPGALKNALPDFSHVTHIFLPVNDCSHSDIPESGSHWSLLLISVVDGVAFHYDSLMAHNEEEAYKVSQKMQAFLGVRLRFIQLNDTPQQENGSDCGVYVCLFMKHLLLKRLLMVRTNDKVSMSMGGRKIDAREGRKEMLKIIEERRKEGERRRSTSKSPAPGSRKSRSPPRIDSPMDSDK
ncbi:hypothetical protein PMZ80_004682 [Knufia obscura]|uniref:Ubiquitin-like protease family profile domain-containing protein n=1 Tax=Knufia obscura TaxID=1635080 RepID=A0ABR0RUE3_9EURO|nr:hypothetical protein PMZ80_004682 [Knufia obscura]